MIENEEEMSEKRMFSVKLKIDEQYKDKIKEGGQKEKENDENKKLEIEIYEKLELEENKIEINVNEKLEGELEDEKIEKETNENVSVKVENNSLDEKIVEEIDHVNLDENKMNILAEDKNIKSDFKGFDIQKEIHKIKDVILNNKTKSTTLNTETKYTEIKDDGIKDTKINNSEIHSTEINDTNSIITNYNDSELKASEIKEADILFDTVNKNLLSVDLSNSINEEIDTIFDSVLVDKPFTITNTEKETKRKRKVTFIDKEFNIELPPSYSNLVKRKYRPYVFNGKKKEIKLKRVFRRKEGDTGLQFIYSKKEQ